MYESIPIPGTVETTSSPVVTHSSMMTMEKHLNVSENCSKEDETDDEEDTYTPNTPSLMEIAASMDALSGAEPTVFTVDESTDTVDYEGPEYIQQVEDVTDDVQEHKAMFW